MQASAFAALDARGLVPVANIQRLLAEAAAKAF
jgi:hypothetical protein